MRNGLDILEKHMKSMKLAAVATMVWAAAGCAVAVKDIDRTQPDYYPKSYFTGTWYMRPTVIDAQYNQAMLFEGLEGGLEKVRWEIQEKQLVAFRAYEAIPNSEENPGSHTPVAIFAIKDHLDVKRDYNAQNGIETNVIVENTVDRPWWERDFVRVDWSANLVPDYDLAGFAQFYGAVNLAINQTGDRYEVEQPRISENYVDVVTRSYLYPDVAVYWMMGQQYDLLEPSIADIRWSFSKVEDRGYDPLLYPDYLPVKVKYRYARQAAGGTNVPCTPSADDRTCVLYGGAPSSGPDDGTCASHSETPTANWNGTALCAQETTLEQDCFCTGAATELLVNGNGNICDSRVGATPDPEDCYAINYPIFEKFGFFRTLRVPYDWERGYTFNGRIYLANRWHIWERSRTADGSVIPEADRVPRPVVYYTNPEFPADLMPEAQSIAADWDVPLRETVAELKGVPQSSVPQMFQIRRNSCNADNVKQFAADHDLDDVLMDAVGGAELVASGNLKRACTALEVATRGRSDGDRFEWQRVGDVRYSFMHWVHKPQLAGPLGYGPSSADPETGEIISANAYIYGGGIDTYANFAADVVQLLNGEVAPQEFLAGDNVVEEISMGRAKVNERLSKRSTRQLMNRMADLEARMGDSYLPRLPSQQDLNHADPASATWRKDQNNRLSLMAPFAAQHLISDDMLRAFAGPEQYQPGGQLTPKALELANPAKWGRFTDFNRASAKFDPAAEAEDDTMGVLNREGRVERFLAERTIEYGSMIAEPAVYGLALSLRGKSREEVVRHARKEIFRAVEAHEVGHTLGLRHNFAGSSDPMNFQRSFWEEQDPALNPASRKWDYAYSSIMDYHQRFNSDWAGIGPYDRAAIKFGYGQLMEVFDERDGDFVPNTYFDFATSVLDYSDLPRVLSGTNVDDAFEGAYYDALSGRTDVVELPPTVVANVDNMYKRRNVPFQEVWKDYNADLLPSWVNGQYRPDYENQMHTVPYQFCSDLYAWGGNLTCNRYDMGGNIQEIVKHAKDMYSGYYLFNNFRRDRHTFLGGPMTFSVGSYLNRLYSRTYQPMLNSFRYFFYYRRSSLRMYPLVADWSAAALNGLNFFAEILENPEPGSYCQKFGRYTRSGCTSSDERITIPVGAGRYFGTNWTNEYYYKATRIGSYWDKWMAVLALTDSQFFLVRDFSSLFDRGAFSITYYRVYEKEMTDLFKSMVEGDLGTFSAGVQQEPETGQWQVIPRPVVSLDTQTAPSLPQIQATTSWTLQKTSALYAMLGFTSSVDRRMDFSRRARITYAGASDDPIYDGFQEAEIMTFTDPATHLTYRAAPVGGLDAPGYRLVQETRTLHDTSWVPAQQGLEQAQVDLDAVIANNASTPEELNAAITARDDAQANFSNIDRALREQIELVEYMRVLGFYLHRYAD